MDLSLKSLKLLSGLLEEEKRHVENKAIESSNQTSEYGKTRVYNTTCLNYHSY